MNQPSQHISSAIELLEDLIGLCNKVAHDNEIEKQVFIGDLNEIHDMVIALRRHLSTVGFKAVPKLKKSDT
jgi:CHAD domain-containing protein